MAMRWLFSTMVAVLIGLSVFATATATAEPSPAPAPPSTTDELADMVMDVIEHGAPALPTTTPVPAPPG